MQQPDFVMPAEVARGRAGGDTAYSIYGSGLPLVLVHGVGMSQAVWAPQIADLARDHRVIAYDLLGHGASALPPPNAQLADYTRQLATLLDELHVPAAQVVGHSMGALVALDFALTHPARCVAVAALNAVFCRSPEQREAVQRRAAALDDIGNSASVNATLARWFDDPVPEAQAPASRLARQLLTDVNVVGYARTYAVFSTADAAHAALLPRLVVPALFMTGEHDPNSTPDMSSVMAGLVPDGRAEVLSGERHMMTLTAPKRVNAALRYFLGASRQGAAEPKGRSMTSTFDAADFRKALGAYPTGVTIVTTLSADGVPRGLTANSFTSVSLDPPLVLVCLGKSTSSHAVFTATDRFAVNVLAEDQRAVSSLFASKSPDKFAQAAWHAGDTGAPLIDGAAANFDCRVHQQVDAGDHTILIGRVVAVDHQPQRPLGYCRGAYVGFDLVQQAQAAAARQARVSAVLETPQGVLLIDGSDGWTLPSAPSLGTTAEGPGLRAVLQGLGIDATLDFLFAVYEDARGPCIVYRGRAAVAPSACASPATLRVLPMDELAALPIPDTALRAMLQRYAKERAEDAFGVYVGDAETGDVRPLAQPA